MLKEIFRDLLFNYKIDEKLITECWTEIETNYSNKSRHYHNLHHLEGLLVELTMVKEKIKNWDVILFSLFYHDIIYNTFKTNNEELSANFALKSLQKIGVNDDNINLCVAQILATKSHVISVDEDTNYFTDADLAILGKSWLEYEVYYKSVRKEYSIYPSFIYNKGRKKVLQHFLNMRSIFKTAEFFSKYEQRAKENLKRELELLS